MFCIEFDRLLILFVVCFAWIHSVELLGAPTGEEGIARLHHVVAEDHQLIALITDTHLEAEVPTDRVGLIEGLLC